MNDVFDELESQLRCGVRARRKPGSVRGWHISTRILGLAALSLVATGLLLGVALIGGGGGGQFDVAAAVYRAIRPGGGVRYVVTEQEVGFDGKSSRNRVERWSTVNPQREHTIWREQRSYGRERSWLDESSIKVGGTSWDWSSNQPGVMLRMKGTAILKDQLEEIRSAYRSGLLRPVEETTLDGRKVYRLRANAGGGPNELFVDAKTFVPVEEIEHIGGPHGHQTVFVLRYRVFKELPATPTNLAKLNMAPHPGTRIITHR
jgi:hypothetical protein